MLSEQLSSYILVKGDFSTLARAGKIGEALGEASGTRPSYLPAIEAVSRMQALGALCTTERQHANAA